MLTYGDKVIVKLLKTSTSSLKNSCRSPWDMIKKGNSSFTYDNNQNNPLTDTAASFSQKINGCTYFRYRLLELHYEQALIARCTWLLKLVRCFPGKTSFAHEVLLIMFLVFFLLLENKFLFLSLEVTGAFFSYSALELKIICWSCFVNVVKICLLRNIKHTGAGSKWRVRCFFSTVMLL